jgi:hypothetical protein
MLRGPGRAVRVPLLPKSVCLAFADISTRLTGSVFRFFDGLSFGEFSRLRSRRFKLEAAAASLRSKAGKAFWVTLRVEDSTGVLSSRGVGRKAGPCADIRHGQDCP